MAAGMDSVEKSRISRMPEALASSKEALVQLWSQCSWESSCPQRKQHLSSGTAFFDLMRLPPCQPLFITIRMRDASELAEHFCISYTFAEYRSELSYQ